MKMQQSEQVDLNQVIHQIFKSRGYNVETLREGLLELYKGWVCSECAEEMDVSSRKELTFQFQIIDEILRSIERAEPWLQEKREAA